MLKLIPVFCNIVKDKLTDFETSVFTIILDKIFQAVQSGESCYTLEVEENIKDYLLILLKKSELFLTVEFSDRFLVLNKEFHSDQFYKSPFVICGNELSLNRYFFYSVYCEDAVSKLVQASHSTEQIDDILTKYAQQVNHAQRKAITNSFCNKFSIITGGPGVGKTTSVKMFLRILSVLHADYSVSICTPTGKATNRIKEVLSAQSKSLEYSTEKYTDNHADKALEQNLEQNILQKFIAEKVVFSTLHALLGLFSGYEEVKPVVCDVLIIDESSMISLFLFYQLLRAVNFNRIKHIILIGDVNQLPSVEVGTVFRDLIVRYPQMVSVLDINHRSNYSVIKLSESILAKSYSQFEHVVSRHHNLNVLKLNMRDLIKRLFSAEHKSYYQYLQQIKALAHKEDCTDDDIKMLFEIYNQFVVLCLLNVGQYGVDNINNMIEQIVLYELGMNQNIYTGKPIIVLRNHSRLGLYNGDIGIVVKQNGTYYVAFVGNNEVQLYPVEVLPQHSLAYTITVHKTQGSEFTNIALIVPDFYASGNTSSNGYGDKSGDISGNAVDKFASIDVDEFASINNLKSMDIMDNMKSMDNKLIMGIYNNQMLYTAVTRAKHGVTIFAGSAEIRYMVETVYQRK
jgi:exodeoxyribonuclease V alpha subunit